MSSQFQQILKQASLLSPQEQLVLIASLSQILVQKEFGTDLDKQVFYLSDDDEKLMQKRMKEVEIGEKNPIPWKEAMTEIRKRQGL